MSRKLLLYYGRCLHWASKHDFLPAWAPNRPVIPKLRTHHIVDSPCGNKRCVHCLRLQSACTPDNCLDVHHVPHRVVVLPGYGLFCESCGAYSFARTCKLARTCRNRISGPAVGRRRDRMLRGLHPVTGQFLALPVGLLDPPQAMWVDLGPSSRVQDWEDEP